MFETLSSVELFLCCKCEGPCTLEPLDAGALKGINAMRTRNGLLPIGIICDSCATR